MQRDELQPMLDWETPEAGDDDAQHVAVEVAADTTGREQVAVVDRRHEPRIPAFHVDRLTREQVIDEIITHNPSASVNFLDDFHDGRLRLYLSRLRGSRQGRGRGTVWVRTTDSPAIVSRERL